MSIRTSRADKNYLGLGANGAVDLYAGTDLACPGTLPDPFVVNPVNPQDWDAVIKAGGGVGNGWTIPSGKASQGRENVVDNNHVHDNSFTLAYGEPGQVGDQVITAKGGSYNLTFGGTIYSKGRNADVVVGAWSDQCFDRSHDLDFSNLRRADGDPVRFVLSRCYNVKLPPNADVLIWKSWAYSAYWWGKWVYVKALKALGKA